MDGMWRTTFAVAVLGLLLASTARAESAWVIRGWAGYVVEAGGRSFTSVSGGWTQPRIVCNRPGSAVAFWIGLGGAHADSRALEQVGTSAGLLRACCRLVLRLVPALPGTASRAAAEDRSRRSPGGCDQCRRLGRLDRAARSVDRRSVLGDRLDPLSADGFRRMDRRGSGVVFRRVHAPAARRLRQGHVHGRFDGSHGAYRRDRGRRLVTSPPADRVGAGRSCDAVDARRLVLQRRALTLFPRRVIWPKVNA
jgi:hypothetical protein